MITKEQLQELTEAYERAEKLRAKQMQQESEQRRLLRHQQKQQHKSFVRKMK